MTYAIVRVRPQGLDLDAFARTTGLHPDLVRRLMALGLLEPDRDAAGRPRFTRRHLTAVARIQRLRAGFALNYAALGLVLDLLDRVAQLEAALARSRPAGGTSWT
jgi:chaperone modulatory protein CbpM